MSDNSLRLHLKLDQASGKKINFLDVQVEVTRNTYKTKVYRKPTYIPIYIPNTPTTKLTHKASAFRALFRRAFTHCSTKADRDIEINEIFSQGRKHGYSNSFLNKMLSSVTKALNSKEKKKIPITEVKYRSFDYQP